MNERDDDKRVGGKPAAPPAAFAATPSSGSAAGTPASTPTPVGGAPADGKTGDVKPLDTKPGEPKPVDVKSVDIKSSDSKIITPGPAGVSKPAADAPAKLVSEPAAKPVSETAAKPAGPGPAKAVSESPAKPAPDLLSRPGAAAAPGPSLGGADPVSKPVPSEPLPATPRPAAPGRGLAVAALVVGAIGLGVGLLAIAGPRAVLLAERQFPNAAWTEGLRASLNPGWSVAPAEFDRRVNLLEGVLAKAGPDAVSRQDVVDLLLGRFEARRSEEIRATVDAARGEVTAAGQRLAAAEAALTARVEPVERATAALDGALGALKASVEEVRGKVEALSALDGRAGKLEGRADGLETRSGQIETRVGEAETRTAAVEAAAAAAAKRAEEVSLAVEELRKRSNGAERLLVATMQLQISAQSGRAFVNELRLARQLAAQDEITNRLLDRLVIPAQRGVATPADLRSQFQDVASVVVDQGIAAEKNWAQRVGSNVRGALAGVGLSAPPDPTRVEAAVTEASRYLASGNLPAALAELNTLEPPLQSLAAGWITQARLRLSVDQTVAEIAQHVLDLMGRGS